MEDGARSSGDGKEEVEREEEEEEENATLRFLDSLDGYLTLVNSVLSTLRQGWIELASARHSMGSSRVSSALLDLNVRSAATTCVVTESIDGFQSVSPHFSLSKWILSRDGRSSSREEEVTLVQNKSGSSQLRHRCRANSPEVTEEILKKANDSSPPVGDLVQKARSKSLSVFGALVSPKLRAAQVSFETALETIVELANMRSSMLAAYSKLQEVKASS